MILHGLRKLCGKKFSPAKCKQPSFLPVFLSVCLPETLLILWPSLIWPSFTSNADSACSLRAQVRKRALIFPINTFCLPKFFITYFCYVILLSPWGWIMYRYPYLLNFCSDIVRKHIHAYMNSFSYVKSLYIYIVLSVEKNNFWKRRITLELSLI